MKSQPVEIKLLGQKIVLKSVGGDPEIIREVVDLVSSRLKDAEQRGKGVAHHVALLALFTLAEEYVHAKRRAASHFKQMDDKSQELLRTIEAEFK